MKTKRVLLVDDEEDLTWSISKHLKKDQEKFELYTANSGQAALEVLKQVPINLVVSDIRMPEMSGLDLLLKIRENYPSTKVIIMTAYGSSEVQDEANERGCFKYIEKPFEIQELRKLILEGVQNKKGFEGRVSDFQLGDIIQMNCLGRLTNALHVRKDDAIGVIFFDDGNITHCEVGELTGEEAIYEILSWEGGTFTVDRGRKARHETIIKGWQSLLIEGLRRADEKRNLDGEQNGKEARIQKILDVFIEKKGVALVVLLGDDDQLLYSSQRKGQDSQTNPESIATALRNLTESTIRLVLNLGKHGFKDMVVEMDEGMFEIQALAGLDEYFIVLAEKSVNMAVLRMETKGLARKLSKELK